MIKQFLSQLTRFLIRFLSKLFRRKKPQRLTVVARPLKSTYKSVSPQGLFFDDSTLDLLKSLDEESFIASSETLTEPATNAKVTHPQSSHQSSLNQELSAAKEFLESQLRQPIGARLLEAGIISPVQLQLALEDQKHQPDFRFGEILLLRNWVKEKTLQFFLNLEELALHEFHNLPLGQRLHWAGLVAEVDIERALGDQRRIPAKMGQILALNRVVVQKTADYFARF